MRPTEALIDLGRVHHNVSLVAEAIAPAHFCAVVKADGYGHGAVAVARTALSAGATWLAVALVEEGIELRESGVEAPILLLSEPRPLEMIEVVEHRLTPTVYTGAGLAAAAAAAESSAAVDVLDVHLKIDTGMHRVGARPEDAVMLAAAVAGKPALRLAGVWTHCAVADEPDASATEMQLDLFDDIVAELRSAGHEDFLVHAGNSAVALAHKRAHHDLVRVGIAMYGIAPSAPLRGRLSLQPVMSVQSAVAFVKPVSAGDRISYGLRHEFTQDTTVATIPIGYADGVRRSYWRLGGEVIVRDRRCPVVGVVTMDQTMVDLGPDSSVAEGDPVIFLGETPGGSISAAEIADKLGTIPYEVVCDIGRRVRRRYI